MKTKLSILLSLCLTFSFGQSPWTSIDEAQISKTNEIRTIIPEVYETYSLDMKTLQKQLANAPMENLQNTRAQGVKLMLPLPGQTQMEFEFVESPCMHPLLAEKYPSIKSYRGISTSGTYNYCRIDYSPSGFRAAISTNKGDVYIDPYYDSSGDSYIVYYVTDHKPEIDESISSCGVQDYNDDMREQALLRTNPATKPSRSQGAPMIKSTYRFALACTGAWGSQQGGTKVAVLSKMNTGVNRLNIFFEAELAMKFELVSNNDEIIFFNNNEPYTDPTLGGVCLRQNTDIINNTIGAASYDFGHLLTVRCTDVGGVAFGSSACTQNKAAGVSCVGNSNIGNFMVSTTAHEIGHQFSASHSWNNCPGSQDQFALQTACEPGSGSTIMSYQGACQNNNISGPGEAYYHICNLEQIVEYVKGGPGSNCGTHEDTDNSIPDVWIEEPQNVVIPLRTPFELTGQAMDMDGDELTYNWDQIDIDFQASLGSPIGDSPAFRSLKPGPNKTRIFPRLSDVLAGRDTNEERMPTYARNFNFAFTARDNNPTAGAVNWATISFRADASATSFRVTEPSSFTTVEVAKPLLVEWDVANTDNDIIDTKFVDIYFSDDGGQTFPIKVLASTPNDGSEYIIVPNRITDNGKVKVKGTGNIFFNINRNVINVVEPSEPGFYVEAPENFFDFCLPGAIETEIQGTAFQGFDEMVNLEIISGLPDEAVFSFSQNPIPANGSSTLSIDFNDILFSDVYNVVLRATAPGADTLEQVIAIEARGSNMDDLQLLSPANGVTGIEATPNFVWSNSRNGTGYFLQVATNPSFDESSLIISKDVGLDTTGTDFVNIDNSTLYYWRVIGDNLCNEPMSTEINTFGSISLSCGAFESDDVPTTISQSGTPTVDTKITLDLAGGISDVNVSSLKGSHTQINETRGSLISPSGTQAILFQGVCANVQTINAGFDDESTFPNGCPDKNGQRIRPFESLSVFDGEPVAGDWILRMEDINPGNGGVITDFVLELCSNAVLDNPFLVNNDVLLVQTGGNNNLLQNLLLTQDNNNTAVELIYTLVTAPAKGDLFLGSSRMIVGSQFSQADINDADLRYQHNGTENEDDTFVFTVIDGEGGWIDKTEFQININEGNPSATNDIEDAIGFFDIYPNPADNLLNITSIKKDNSDWQVSLVTLEGRTIKDFSFNNNTKIDVSNINSGLYILRFLNGETQLSHKLTIVK